MIQPEEELYNDPTLVEAKKRMFKILKVHDAICRKHGLKYWIDWGTLLGAVRHKGFIPWDDDIDVSMPRADLNKYMKIVENELPEDMVFQSRKTDRLLKRHKYNLRDLNSEIVHKFIDGEFRGVFIDIFPVDSVKSSRLFLAPFFKTYFSIDYSKKTYASFSRRLIHYILSPFLLFKPLVRFIKNKFIFDEKNGDIYVLDWEYNDPGQYKKSYCDELIELEFEGELFFAPKEYDLLLTELYGDYMTPPEIGNRAFKHHDKIIFK